MKKQITFEELRKAGRWTRKLLAEKIGVSPGAFHYWERGTVYPTMDKIVKLAEILETTPYVIFNSLVEQKRQLDTTVL